MTLEDERPDMGADTTGYSLTSGTGFLAMFGGVVLVFSVLLLGSITSVPDQVAMRFFGLMSLPFLLLVPGVWGLYRRHGDRFGIVAAVGAVMLWTGLLANALNAVVVFASGDPPLQGLVGLAVVAALVLGSLVVGVAVAHAGELPHATVGGVLLALGLPVGVGLALLLALVLELSLPAVVMMLVQLGPFAAAWIVLGFDLVYEHDREKPGAVADLRG